MRSLSRASDCNKAKKDYCHCQHNLFREGSSLGLSGVWETRVAYYTMFLICHHWQFRPVHPGQLAVNLHGVQ